MKTRSFTFILMAAIAVSSLSLNSCKKEGCTDETALNYDSEADKDDDSCEYEEVPEITFDITSPAEHTTFMLGDTVHISSMFETTGEVHGYSVKIINLSNNNEEVFSKEEHAHESPIHIHEMWVNNVTMHSDMRLDITVEIDHDGTEEVKSIGFHCMHMM